MQVRREASGLSRHVWTNDEGRIRPMQRRFDEAGRDLNVVTGRARRGGCAAGGWECDVLTGDERERSVERSAWGRAGSVLTTWIRYPGSGQMVTSDDFVEVTTVDGLDGAKMLQETARPRKRRPE